MADVQRWTCDEQQRVVFANRGTERLLGLSSDVWQGRPCYELISGRDREGHRVCCRACPVFARATRGDDLEPLTLEVRDGEDHVRFIRVFPFVEHRESGTLLLAHVAEELDAEHRAQIFLETYAAHVRPKRIRDRLKPASPLTPREHEILDCLAHGADSKCVARELHVSYVTVRNHLQHLLPKLGAHSILEAVAVHLLQ